MIPQIISQRKLSTSQISVAAEAFAAAQFALAGFDVLEQAGRARFYFDLAVARSGGMMKVSVYASFNGFWDLVDKYLSSPSPANATAEDYHNAIDRWLETHNSTVTCCLVQFEPADLHRMPRLYLASPVDVAVQLHEQIDHLESNQLGPMGMDVVHRLEGLPPSWRFSQARISELMDLPAEETAYVPYFSTATSCKQCAESRPAACLKCLPMMN